MEANLIDDKRELRRAARARRDQVTPAQAKAAAKQVSQRVLTEIAALDAVALEAVALYAAIRSEVPTGDLANALASRGSTLAYPRIDADRLSFRTVVDLGELEVGTFGVREPSPDAPIAFPLAIKTIVLPGLAFDRQGRRLGWGRGHYDRAIEQHRHALRVAIAYDHQIIAEVPADTWDVPVDIIITEEESIVCPGADRDRSH